MKTAGDVLSALFGNEFVQTANKHSKLFDSWTDITAKNGIAAAAAHSRIKNLNNGILLIEMDHPGWKQILQTKQSKLLNDFRIRFPDMNICGISLMLGKVDQDDKTDEQSADIEVQLNTTNKPSATANQKFDAPSRENSSNENKTSTAEDIEAISDNELKQKLLSLGQAIAEREKV